MESVCDGGRSEKSESNNCEYACSERGVLVVLVLAECGKGCEYDEEYRVGVPEGEGEVYKDCAGCRLWWVSDLELPIDGGDCECQEEGEDDCGW